MDSSILYDDGHVESVSYWSLFTNYSMLTRSQHLTKSQVLEMAYQESLRKSDVIIKDESARRLRLRILLLENENDDLHEQLALADDRIDGLEQATEELQGQYDQAQEDARLQESNLRVQTRELYNLKVCWIGSPVLSSIDIF